MNNISINYDKIALEFDKTRISIWNNVKHFLYTKQSDQLLLDAGCGNGKNMLYAKELKYETYGFDICDKLLEICNKKGLIVYKNNILSLLDNSNINNNIDNKIFDKILCIAVIHHLDNIKDQYIAICNLIELLNDKGELLISVWSLEKTPPPYIIDTDIYYNKKNYKDFKLGNNILYWRLKSGELIERYYYIHDYISFVSLVKLIKIRYNISYEITWEKQNWFCKFKKL